MERKQLDPAPPPPHPVGAGTVTPSSGTDEGRDCVSPSPPTAFPAPRDAVSSISQTDWGENAPYLEVNGMGLAGAGRRPRSHLALRARDKTQMSKVPDGLCGTLT